MKLIPNLTLILFACLFASCQSNYVKVDPSEINQERLEFATSISKKILMAQKSGTYYPLNKEEATQTLVDGLNEELQKESYQKIKSSFGDYQGIVFNQLKKATDGSLHEMYRFKGKFNPEFEVEVRTVLDANGKLTGFFVKPWKD